MLPVRPGVLLVASPLLTDPNFARSVVYVLEHNERGTLGLIINRPLDIAIGELWSDCPSPWRDQRRCGDGGPVERDKGLVLHGDIDLPDAMPLGAGLAVGGDTAALDPGDPLGPRLFLGHSGWSEGQLDSELAIGSWLVRNGNRHLALDPECSEGLWEELVRTNEEGPAPSTN